MLAIGTPGFTCPRRAIRVQGTRLVPGRALHADGDPGRCVVPVPQFGRRRLAVLAEPLGRARGMVSNHHGRTGQGLHVGQGLDHPAHLVAGRINRPGLELVEAALEVRQVVALLRRVGHDDAGVVSARAIQLKAEEEGKVGDFPAGLEHFRIGEIAADPGVVGAAVVGGGHPGQTVLAGHAGIGRDGVVGVAADDGIGCLCRVRRGLPVDAELGVHVVVARLPGAAIFMPAVGRAGLVRGGGARQGKGRGGGEGEDEAGSDPEGGAGHGQTRFGAQERTCLTRFRDGPVTRACQTGPEK